MSEKMYCKFCGQEIDSGTVVCPHCGRQVKELEVQQPSQPQVIINNTNANTNVNNNNNNNNGNAGGVRFVNKWVAFFLCLFFGYLGAHKFYEGKIGQGILYLLTGGLFGIGWIIDIFRILVKPNPYPVN